MNCIPKLDKYLVGEGNYIITKSTTASFDKHFLDAKNLFNQCFSAVLGNTFEEGKDIVFVLNKDLLDEQYAISINSDQGIRVTASGKRGALYAVQTLRQILNLDLLQKVDEIICPVCEIFDQPKYSWRGLSMDVARHFFNKEEMLRLLDNMARMKLNVLHWHLSDDQGFRIEIEKYKKLNSVGSYRRGTLIHDGREHTDEIIYGGYYRKDEIVEIVKYADCLGIDVVPEIDLPGHTVAIGASYPNLTCSGNAIVVRNRWGISQNILCAGNDETYKFMYDVFDEICELFPSRYIHLGGDEAPKNEWAKCPKCQAKLKELSLHNFEELQGYLFNTFAKYLKEKGKTVIGWNECLNDNLSKDVICQHWTPKMFRRNKTTIKHLEQGRKTIVSDFLSTYFDYPYAMTPLKKTFGFSPSRLLKKMTKNAEKNIIGTECNMWTEWVPNREKLEFNLYPRLCAYAETAWDYEKPSYVEFTDKLADYYKVYDKLGIGYAKNMEKPAPLLKGIYYGYLQAKKDAFVELNKQKRK